MHFLCVLQTLVGGRGSSRNRCSEPARDQYQETVSFLQMCTSKVGEASLEVEGRLVSEQRGRLSGKAGPTFSLCKLHPEALTDKNKS